MPPFIAVLLIGLHAVAATIWIGGMFFAYMAARPAAGAVLGPPERCRFWDATFTRFFPWVWVSVVILLGSGFGLIFGFYGGMAGVGGDVHAMLLLGLVMMTIFAHIYLSPYRRLRRAVVAEDWSDAGRCIGRIRLFIAINLALGLITVAAGSGSRFL